MLSLLRSIFTDLNSHDRYTVPSRKRAHGRCTFRPRLGDGLIFVVSLSWLNVKELPGKLHISTWSSTGPNNSSGYYWFQPCSSTVANRGWLLFKGGRHIRPMLHDAVTSNRSSNRCFMRTALQVFEVQSKNNLPKAVELNLVRHMPCFSLENAIVYS